MLLWLQRAWSSYLRAAVIRGVKSVDAYKTSARIILVRRLRGARGRRIFTHPSNRQNPIRASSVWEMICGSCIDKRRLDETVNETVKRDGST